MQDERDEITHLDSHYKEIQNTNKKLAVVPEEDIDRIKPRTQNLTTPQSHRPFSTRPGPKRSARSNSQALDFGSLPSSKLVAKIRMGDAEAPSAFFG
jgi:hypothetical protein